MTAPLCLPANPDCYLGPGAAMLKLVNPDAGITDSIDRARVAHTLLSGAVGVQHVGKSRRTIGLSWSQRTPDVADQLISIQDGLLGVGPYYFVSPAWRNVLPSHIASCGKRKASSVGFVATLGSAVAYTVAGLPPAAAALSGVQLWSAIAATRALWINASAPFAQEGSNAPAIKALPITVAMYLQTLTSTLTLTIGVQFADVNGTNISTVTAATVTASTTQARYSGTIAAASIPSNAASFSVVLTASSGTAVAMYVSAIDAQYVTASAGGTGLTLLPPWVHGLGVPKVNIVDVVPAGSDGVYWRRTQSLALAEAV